MLFPRRRRTLQIRGRRNFLQKRQFPNLRAVPRVYASSPSYFRLQFAFVIYAALDAFFSA